MSIFSQYKQTVYKQAYDTIKISLEDYSLMYKVDVFR